MYRPSWIGLVGSGPPQPAVQGCVATNGPEHDLELQCSRQLPAEPVSVFVFTQPRPQPVAHR